MSKPETPKEILVRVDWTIDGERFPESTTLEKLPQMLASIDSQGGEVIGVRAIEPIREAASLRDARA